MSNHTYNNQRSHNNGTSNNNNRNNVRSNHNNVNSTRGNNRANNFSLTYDQRALIMMYQGFYDSISRQMNELYRTQDEIRDNINYIIRNPSVFSNYAQSQNENQNSGFGTRSGTTRATSSNNERVYIDGQPYILEYQHQYIPFNPSYNWSDSSYNYSSHHYNDSSGNFGSGNSGLGLGLGLGFGLQNGYNNALNLLQQFYSNVPVVPTSQQIFDGTLVGPFCQMVSPTNNSCPISLEPFEINSFVTQIRGCGHIFNSDNIQSWFRSNPRCPVCRYDIRDYVPYTRPTTTTDVSGNTAEVEAEAEPQVEVEVEVEAPSNNSEQSQNNQSPRPNSRSQNRNAERNSNSTRPLSTSANLTGMILSQLLSSVTGNRVNINNPQYTFDSSNNEIILEGFLRDFD